MPGLTNSATQAFRGLGVRNRNFCQTAQHIDGPTPTALYAESIERKPLMASAVVLAHADMQCEITGRLRKLNDRFRDIHASLRGTAQGTLLPHA